MSYNITLRNKQILTVSTERGENLKNLLTANKPPTYIEIEGNMYRLNEITAIELARDANAQPDFDRPTLPAGPTCHGEFSIQRRITELIKQKYPREWAKHIGNTRERELIRQALRKKESGPWCDGHAGECACNTKQLTMAAQA